MPEPKLVRLAARSASLLDLMQGPQHSFHAGFLRRFSRIAVNPLQYFSLMSRTEIFLRLV
jgi:hypothetical protein